MDALLTFAEIAIAIGGFASIFVVLKNNNKVKWNKHVFQGLLGHSLIAVFASFMPYIIRAFTDDINYIWTIPSLALGVWNIFQSSAVFVLDKKTSKAIVTYTFFSGLSTGIICVLNGLSIYFDGGPYPFYIGVIWHLSQGMLIFYILMNSFQEE